jgi:hypothetical protein
MEGRSVRRDHRWAGGAALAIVLLLSACAGSPSDEPALEEPAIVEHPEGSAVAHVTLTKEAVERVQIQTTRVEVRGRHKIVPSAAVLVDPDGVFWVYTNPEPLVFIREEIEIDHEEAGTAFLVEGPPVETRVVTVGVAELYGAEFEIGH